MSKLSTAYSLFERLFNTDYIYEDLNSVATKEGRDKTFNWVTGDVMPLGDKQTKIIVIGNLLHNDSVIMRLKKNIDDKKMDGIFKSYPLISENDSIAWPGKYPTMSDIEIEKKRVGDEISWQREFMLKIIPNSEKAIHPGWIHYYDILPPMDKQRACYVDLRKYAEMSDIGKRQIQEQIRQNAMKPNAYPELTYLFTATGIDLAASQKQSADFTAMVSASVYKSGKGTKIFIHPNPINEKLAFPQIIETAKKLSLALGNGFPTKLFVEETAMQQITSLGVIPWGQIPWGQVLTFHLLVSWQ